MLEVFSLFSDEQRSRYISEHAVYLLSIEHEHGLRRLFSCDDFFVEFQFPNSDSESLTIQVFNNLFFLEPYLVAIDLPELLD